MSSNSYKICTIIVSWNFEKWLKPCLNSLRNAALQSTVLVIDNHSTDKTCAIIKADYPEIILIENNENLGFGKANNIGLRYAVENNYDFVFLLNQDAWIETDTLDKLIDAAVKYPQLGIISPLHLNGSGKELDFGFSTYSGLKTKAEATNISEEIVTCKFINAAFWLLPVAVIKKIGGFAPIFPHYGEDVNYAQRVRFHQLKIGFVPDALAYHDRESRTVGRKQFFYSEQIYFLTEAVNIHYPLWKAFGYSVVAAIKKSIAALFQGKLRDSLEYLKITGNVLGKTSAVRLTREETKEAGGVYL